MLLVGLVQTVLDPICFRLVDLTIISQEGKLSLLPTGLTGPPFHKLLAIVRETEQSLHKHSRCWKRTHHKKVHTRAATPQDARADWQKASGCESTCTTSKAALGGISGTITLTQTQAATRVFGPRTKGNRARRQLQTNTSKVFREI